MKKILVCMQHKLTKSQLEDLVSFDEIVYLKDLNEKLYNYLCNMDAESDVSGLVQELISTIRDNNFYHVLLPIGSPFFMSVFIATYSQYSCDEDYFFPFMYFSHTQRKSIETVSEDGTIVKTTVFEHIKYNVFRVEPNNILTRKF